MMLRYHARTLELMGVKPSFSEANARMLAVREAAMGVRLPDSVREWYSLDGCTELMRTYSNNDRPVALGLLGQPADNWYGMGHRDFVAQAKLHFMSENQSVCNWAVALDDGDDPPVFVEVDSENHDEWQPCTATFSEFLRCQAWDHPQDGTGCCAQAGVSAAEIAKLKSTYKQEAETYGWPGDVNHRFSTPWGRVLIWTKGDLVDWWLFPNSNSSLPQLVQAVWDFDNLAVSLYGLDEFANQTLERLRAGTSSSSTKTP